jgi:threonine dehydratase
MIQLENILNAKKSFGEFIPTTLLEKSERLSKKYGAEIYLKREDLNTIRSYKIRGAFSLISSLSAEERKAWIVCASAGNHAQWVAMTCKELKIKWAIFMPLTTPEQKVYKTKQFGWEFVEVFLIWDTFDEASMQARKYEKEKKAVFVHPFDDERIISWQATIGLEIYEKFGTEEIDYIICPVWWGGLISGIIKVTEALKKNTKIIGVEPLWANSMKNSLEKWENTTLEKINIFVDGASVRRVGDKNFEICSEYNLEVLTSPENRVCSTILEYLREDGIVVEPAWALSTDILKDLKEKIKGKKVVLIVSGGNFDFERLPEVKERSMKFEGKKRYFIISFPQRPGALKDFLWCLWPNDDIARFEYMKKSNKDRAPVLIWIECENKENFEKIEKKMTELGFKFEDITDNEIYFDLLI